MWGLRSNHSVTGREKSEEGKEADWKMLHETAHVRSIITLGNLQRVLSMLRDLLLVQGLCFRYKHILV